MDPITYRGRVLYAPTARQSMFHDAPQRYRLYGGAAGGGKSDALRWEVFRQCATIPNWPGLILRKTRPELQQSHIDRFRKQVPTELYTWSEQQKTARLPNGSSIRFDYCERDADVYRYQSDEYGVIGVDELTHHSEFVWEYLRSRNRAPESCGKRPCMIAGTNPGGVGHAWVKARWVDHRCSPGIEASSYRPDEHGFVPARVDDNPHINAEYVEDLRKLPPLLRAQLLEGSWDSFVGQFFDRWDYGACTFDDGSIALPLWWPRWIAGDWGYAHDSAFYWGTTDGIRTYVYRELIVRRLEPVQLAAAIVDATPEHERECVRDLYLSPDAFARRTSERSIADDMADVLRQAGMPSPSPADNSRVTGWGVMRQGIHERTTLIARSCTALIEGIPRAIHDEQHPEDVLKHDGDDAVDAARYLLSSRKRLAEMPKDLRIAARVTAQDPTSRAMQARIAASEIGRELDYAPRRSGAWWGQN